EKEENTLFENIPASSAIWKIPGEEILTISNQAEVLATSDDSRIVAFRVKDEETYGLQFLPEAHQTEYGRQIFESLVLKIAKIEALWTPAAYVENMVQCHKKKIGEDKVVLGLSGGVDSTGAAMLLHK